MFKDGCETSQGDSAKTLHNMLRTSLTWKNLEEFKGRRKEARDKVSAVGESSKHCKVATLFFMCIESH